MTDTTEKSTRELELEVQLWQARGSSVQNAVNSLNAQAELLKRESAEVNAGLAAATAALEERKKANTSPAEAAPAN
jgi:hypothetical protein